MSKVVEKFVTVHTDSAMISEMTFDRQDFKLYVTFRTGGRYLYDGVPERVFNKLIAESTESIGKFFHANIRKYPALYPYTRLDS